MLMASQSFLVFQCFLLGIEVINFFWGVILEMFVVDDAAQWQAVALGWMFVRPSDGEGSHRHHEFRQFQSVDDHLWHIHRGAQEAGSQTSLFCQVGECLREEQGIGSRIHEREDVVVSRSTLAVFRPEGGAAIVGADGEHHRSACYHRLVEVGRSQGFLAFFASGYHHAVELQVAHGRSTHRLFEQLVQKFICNLFVGIFADRGSVLD